MPQKRITPSPGPQGSPGPANTLTIGTVTKIAAGGTPTAAVTGTAPNQTLDLGLVTGDTGSASSFYRYFLTGGN